jgi:dienelactone hydrolase
MRRIVRRSLIVLSLIVLGAAVLWALTYARSASFIIRAAQFRGFLLEAAKVDAQPFTIEKEHTVATRHGVIRARLYRPDNHIRRSVLLVPGVHAMGIEEPRLVAFAGELAASGLAVLTAEQPDQKAYQFTPDAVDMIEDGAAWLLTQSKVTRDGKVGLMGISFAGGLSVVAGGRPRIRDRLAYVFSLGGHGDLRRALRYLCTGIEPHRPGDAADGAAHFRAPHDYGVAIILLGLADRMVPADQVPVLRQGILTFLRASQLDTIDKARAAPVFEESRRLMALAPEPSATLLRQVNTRNVKELGPRLLPVLDQMPYSPALSPERSPAPRAPVYLLHGTDDNVIPSVETLLLAQHLAGQTHVRYLLSDLISHAQVDRSPGAGDVMKLVGFWAAVLGE